MIAQCGARCLISIGLLQWLQTTLLISHACCAQFVSEASATLARRAAGTAEDVWLKSNLYPDYYLNTFHFQVRALSALSAYALVLPQGCYKSKAL